MRALGLMTRPLRVLELDEMTASRLKESVVSWSEHAFTFLERLIAEASTVTSTWFSRTSSIGRSVPTPCYGAVTRNIHGADESVERVSNVKGAQTLARFIAGLDSANGLL